MRIYKNIYFLRLLSVLVLTTISSQSFASGSCAGIEDTSVDFDTPTTDFIIHNDGTVTHKTTGLMWMRCSQGQTWTGTTCSGMPSDYIWRQALTLTNTTFAGYSDWRVPNVKELFSIAETRCGSAVVNSEIFPSTVALYYWTSTPDRVNSWANDYAYIIHFNTSGAKVHSTPKSGASAQTRGVRLVRVAL